MTNHIDMTDTNLFLDLEVLRDKLQTILSLLTNFEDKPTCHNCAHSVDDDAAADSGEGSDEDDDGPLLDRTEVLIAARYVRALRRAIDPDDIRVVIRQLEHAAGVLVFDEVE